jgi:hypothetical protein
MIVVFLHLLFVFFNCSSSARLSVHFPALFTAFVHRVTPHSVSSANLGAVGRVHADAAAVAASKRRLPEEGGDSNPSDSVASNVSAVGDSTDQRCDDDDDDDGDNDDDDDDDDDDDHDHDHIFFCWRICFSDRYGLGYSRWMAMLFPPPRKLAAILTWVNERKFNRGKIEYMAQKKLK